MPEVSIWSDNQDSVQRILRYVKDNMWVKPSDVTFKQRIAPKDGCCAMHVRFELNIDMLIAEEVLVKLAKEEEKRDDVSFVRVWFPGPRPSAASAVEEEKHLRKLICR